MTSGNDRPSEGPAPAKRRHLEGGMKLPEFLAAVNSEESAVAISGILRFKREISRPGGRPLLEQYLLSSPHCSEVFSAWRAAPPADQHAIVDCLATILRRNTGTATRHLSAHVAKEAVRTRMKAVYQLMGDGTTMRVMPALRLLSAIAALGPAPARDLFAHTNFALDPFSGLAGRRAKRTATAADGGDSGFLLDIRTEWMRLIVSLLNSGDATLVHSIISHPLLLPPLFETIERDPAPLLEEFFDCLRGRLLRNPDLSRRSKTMVFTPLALDHLAQLLSSPSPKAAAVAHEFLCELVPLMSSAKEFTTDDLAAALPAREKALLALLRNLHPASENSGRHRQLCLAVLEHVPSLFLPFMYRFLVPEPQLSLGWLDVSAFVVRVVCHSPLPRLSSADATSMNGAKIASLVDLVAPLERPWMSRGFQSPYQLVRFRVLDILLAMLSRVEALLETFRGLPSAASLRGAIKARLPSIQPLLAVRSHCCTGPGFNSLMLGQVFAALTGYMRCFPELSTEDRFHVDRAIGDVSPLDALARLRLVRLLSASPDTCLPGVDRERAATFTALCHCACAGNAPEVAREAGDQVKLMLRRSGLIRDEVLGDLEAVAWLHGLNAATVPFFQSVVSELVTHANRFVPISPSPVHRFVAAALQKLTPSSGEETSAYLSKVLSSVLPMFPSPPTDLAQLLDEHSEAIKSSPVLSEAAMLIKALAADVKSVPASDLTGKALANTEESFGSLPPHVQPLAALGIVHVLQISMDAGADTEPDARLMSLLNIAARRCQHGTRQQCTICAVLMFRGTLVSAAVSGSEPAISLLEGVSKGECAVGRSAVAEAVSGIAKKLTEPPLGEDAKGLEFVTKFTCALSTEGLAQLASGIAPKLPKSMRQLLASVLSTCLERKVLFEVLDQRILEAVLSSSRKVPIFDKLLRAIFEAHASARTTTKCKFDVLLCRGIEELSERCVSEPSDDRFGILAAISQLSPEMAGRTFSSLLRSNPELVRGELLPALVMAIPSAAVPREYASGLLLRLVQLAAQFPENGDIVSVAREVLDKQDLLRPEDRLAAVESILSSKPPLCRSQIGVLEAAAAGLEAAHQWKVSLRCLRDLSGCMWKQGAEREALSEFIVRRGDWLPVKSLRQKEAEGSAPFRRLYANSAKGTGIHSLLPLKRIIEVVFSDCKPIKRRKRLTAIHDAFAEKICSYPSSVPWAELSDVLRTIYELEPSICASESARELVPALAREFHGTTSRQDLAIFRALRVLDKHGAPLSIVGYAWGKLAWAIAKTPGSANLAEAVLSKAGGLLDPKLVAETLDAFPWERTLESTGDGTDNGVYDPVLLLPVLLRVAGNMPTPGCKAFAEVGALSIAICSLACADDTLRSAAYAILAKFSESLKNETLSNKPQLVLLLGVLRNSITMPEMRIPACHAAFLSRAVAVVIKPDHFMFDVTNRFLLSAPLLNFNEVPLVDAVLSSVTSDSLAITDERKWVLDMLLASVGPNQEYTVWMHSGVLDAIMTEFHNPATDKKSKEKIMAIIGRVSEKWGWRGHRSERAFLLAWLCDPRVVGPFTDRVSSIVTKLSRQSADTVQEIGRELYSAASCLIRFGAVEPGLEILHRVSEALPYQSMPPKLYSALCSILSTAIAANDCQSSRLVVETIVNFVHSSQDRPGQLNDLIRREIRIVPPEKRNLCIQWLNKEI